MNPFDLSKDHTLEDERVCLRPLQQDDLRHLALFAENEPEIWKYSFLKVSGKENLEKYIASTLQARKAGSEYPFIVFDKKTRQYAGSTRFYDIQLPFQTLQLGYTWYGKAFQGTGLNKHCKFLLLQFAFEQMHLLRVEFRADNNNKRSIAAMKSIGCTEEGVLRQNMPLPEGGRRDSIVLSILKSEWDGEVKEKLKQKLFHN